MTESYRIEKDSMGDMQVPDWALWGASTQRAVENFPIAHRPVPVEMIHAFGHLKAACAQANLDLGKLDTTIARAIIDTANEVAQGGHDGQFPVDVYQTGSGTSTNMNANEVIANLATSRLRLSDPDADRVHPNDHVNMGQSSNDVIPTTIHVSGALAIHEDLVPALRHFHGALDAK
ncbi:MAG: lyase family protein, partial [Phycisphaeraceae bacterium]|nr:lyase family protein [Phycisphaeraceae bacterium]